MPAQKHLVKILQAPINCKTINDQYQRRNNAIKAVIAYYKVEEDWSPMCHSGKRKQPLRGPPPITSNMRDPPQGSALLTALMSVYDEKRPRRCFLYVGKARSLGESNPSFAELIHEFYTAGDLTKHFRRKHLRHIKEDKHPWCLACNMQLDYKMHL